jgi:cell division protein FtsL
MKAFLNIVAVILIIFGIYALSYKEFTYNTAADIVKIGSIKITTRENKAIKFSPLSGGLSLAIGIGLIILGKIKP